MTRTDTADVVPVRPGPNGTVRKSRRITIKRSCDDCGVSVGDATESELEAAVCGHPLPSVAAEHRCQAGATVVLPGLRPPQIRTRTMPGPHHH